jgi:membrane fusion protein, multidrug efflux system
MKLPRGLLSLLTVLVIVSGIGGAVGWRLLKDARAQSTEAAADSLPDVAGSEVVASDPFMGAQPVEGVEVVKDTLWVRVVAAGEAAASRRSAVATRAPGVVERVLVRENDRVAAGQLLVQIDTTEAVMNLAQARSEKVRAEATYKERMLYGGNTPLDAAAQAERERIVRAESGLTNAELSIQRRELELEMTRVRAPFAGRIANLRAVEGAYLNNGGEVLTLVQLDPIRVEVNVLEGEINYLTPGRRASVLFNALPGETFNARVESVNPIVDPNTRTGRVTLTLPNPQGKILPGYYARVSLDAEAFTNRILVPREAVVQRGDKHRDVVFMLKDKDDRGYGLAEWRYVTVGRRNDEMVEIIPSADTSMLEPGEIVLVNGHHYLAHDTQVRLVENVEAAGGRPGGE